MAGLVANGQGRSMAIWCPLKGTPTGQPSVELHFNLWRMGHRAEKADKAQAPDLLDVGILVTAPSDLASVSLYLPIAINNDDIEDLGPKFIDHALATGIFNENLTASNGHTGSLIILKNASGGIHCGVFNFPTSNGHISSSDLEIKPEYDGTTVTITRTALDTGCSGIEPTDKLYFRLRITIPKNGANTFINAAIPGDNWLTSGVDVTEYLDFRLNQARNLNAGISRHLGTAAAPAPVPITRLDFLLVVGVAVDVVVGHPVFHKCRLLETGLWRSYMDEAHLQKGMVIYHWKNDPACNRVDDFNAFVKLRLRLTENRIIKRYLLIALMFGGIVGMFGNTLYDVCKWTFWRVVDRVSGTTESAATPPTRAICPEIPPPVALPAPKVPNASGDGKIYVPAVNGSGPGTATNGNAGMSTGLKGAQ